MISDFERAYEALNDQQRQAVDAIDGPLLVLAGPGTGKTQLLSTRAANIVRLGNATPENILCLTYTEAGAAEMRARLSRIMGAAGSEVAVFTFHGFGSWLISQYPDKFSAERALQPLDDLRRFQLLEGLLQALPLRHPLAVRDGDEHFIRQHAVSEAIQAFKQAGLTPPEIQKIIASNAGVYSAFEPLLADIFGSSLSAKRLPAIRATVEAFTEEQASSELLDALIGSLQTALSDSQTLGKTAPLGSWRNAYTTVQNGQRVCKGQATSQLLQDTVDLYDKYNQALYASGHYDYEDMVLWASRALQADSDLLLDVAERFQYVMVDEFQDTNGAQNHLLTTLLSAHPLDVPNSMVVGDDDQAIMRFQGATAGSMLDFIERYQPAVITLQANYRSGQPILAASRQVIVRADGRLEASAGSLTGSKALQAQNQPAQTVVQHQQYASQSLQFEAVATQVASLLTDGVEPGQIGIIGRKHAELSQFVPYVLGRGIIPSYDRRENILDQPTVRQLLHLARVVEALTERPKQAAALLPELLAAPYWQLEPLAVYKLAAEARLKSQSWLDTMLATPGRLADSAEWLLAAANAVKLYNFTRSLDILLGREALANTRLQTSPFAAAYQGGTPAVEYGFMTQLLRLREVVLTNRPATAGLGELLSVAAEYRRSGLYLTSNNPILQGSAAGVAVMTAHGAKGREFEHVFILSCIDEVWGNRARSNNQRIRLPENLPLYPAGDTESDRLRLLYVAMTRAKSHLNLTSYSHTENGKATTPLGLIALGGELSSGWWQPRTVTASDSHKLVAADQAWSVMNIDARDRQQVLAPLLANFRLSASALRSFLDICYSGPEACLEAHVLGFPSAYTAATALGSAVHKVLHTGHQRFQQSRPLGDAELLELFDSYLLASGLPEAELVAVRGHGHSFLPAFMRQFSGSDFANIIQTEQYLAGELPDLGIPLSGAIDAIADGDGQLKVVDYKTGRPPLPDWRTTGLSDSKKIGLHFYRQQLLFYKLLADGSRAYGRKQQAIKAAELVFVEPSTDTPNGIVRLAIASFDNSELQRLSQLIAAVYRRILAVDLPDTTAYSRSLAGIEQFEADLLK